MNADFLLRQITDAILLTRDFPTAQKYRAHFQKKGFLREAGGKFQNKSQHVGIFVCLFDPSENVVWLGLHKKSGLWLPAGEHLEDFDESLRDAALRCLDEEYHLSDIHLKVQNPEVYTETAVQNNPTCKTHYDLWFFVEVEKQSVTWVCDEFHAWEWVNIEVALHHDSKWELTKEISVGLKYLGKRLKHRKPGFTQAMGP